jgi:UDP:flavonoid glycosyltransferase YjiC (YdhE family)
MARFLFTTLPTDDLGLLTRSLPIAHELDARGHSIVFCSPAKAPRRLIAQAGFANLVPKHPLFELAATGPGIRGLAAFIAGRRWRAADRTLFGFLRQLLPALPIKSAPATSEIWDVDHAAAVMGMLNERFVRAMCDALLPVIDDAQPDVVVDFWNPCAAIAARMRRRPLVTVIQADAHPMSQGFIWWKPRPSNVPTPVNVVNRVLGSQGLSRITTLRDLAVGDLTLVVGTPETDPLPATADVTYVGPVLWQNGNTSLPASITHLPSDKPLVWVYSGNPRYGYAGGMFDSIVLLRACKEALGGEDMRVVLTTGFHRMPNEILPLPSNFQFEPFVPGLAMASKSDTLVHHGGFGSCQTGLYCGKPAAIVPTFSERESNARRVAGIGAGLVVPVEEVGGQRRVSPDRLRAAILRTLTDRSLSDSARHASERLRAYGGPPRAAQLIEDFTRTTR